MPAAVERLKRRKEFLRVAAGRRKAAAPGLVLQVREAMDAMPTPAPRIGFTASRKVGNAVARNRAKRRLRALTDRLISEADPALDYVLVGRTETLTRDFAAMETDLRAALKKIAAPHAGSPRR